MPMVNFFVIFKSEKKATGSPLNQRTNGPVNAHLMA